MKVETTAVVGGALFADVWGLLAPEIVAATLLPSVLGALIHTWLSVAAENISVPSIVVTFLTAGCVGFWGGPWIAELVPASATALPMMCFLTSLYARTFIDGAASIFKSTIKHAAKDND